MHENTAAQTSCGHPSTRHWSPRSVSRVHGRADEEEKEEEEEEEEEEDDDASGAASDLAGCFSHRQPSSIHPSPSSISTASDVSSHHAAPSSPPPPPPPPAPSSPFLRRAAFAASTLASLEMYPSASVSGRYFRVDPYKATPGWSSKASVGVERRRGVSGLKARGDGRRETPAEVLKDRRSQRQRGRMGTSVIYERASGASSIRSRPPPSPPRVEASRGTPSRSPSACTRADREGAR